MSYGKLQTRKYFVHLLIYLCNQVLLLESILPEIIFFQRSQQSFWPIFPPIFLNLMFIYFFIFFSCVISKGKKHILKDSFLRQCSIRDFKQIVPINSNFLAPIWAKYFVRTPKSIKSLAKQPLLILELCRKKRFMLEEIFLQ